MHRLLAVAAILLGPALAQPTFEVASIKRDPFNGQGGIGIRVTGNRLLVEHPGLADVVAFAYGIEDFQLSGGPAWAHARPMDADAFQVIAKAEGDSVPTKEQFQEMLQALLADRFQLKIHREAKEMQAYELVVARSGPKLKDATADPNVQTIWKGGNVSSLYSAKKTSMATLAWMLRTQVGRPVIDKTGLTGSYDFDLQYAPGNPPPADATDPSILTAVQEQLGLKLEPVKASFPVIVIAHAERASEN